MATDTPASDDPRAESFASRPARTPPTLDLTAEERAAPDATSAAEPAAGDHPDRQTPADDVAPAPQDAPPDAAEGTSGETTTAEQAAEAAVAADAEPAPPPAAPPSAPGRSGSVLAALIAGIIGGAAAGGGLWYALPLLVPPASPPPPAAVQPAPRVDLTPLQNRIAALEARPAGDANAVAALSARLERSETTLKRLEDTVASLKTTPAPAASAPAPAVAIPPALTKSVDDLRAGADASREALAALRREVDALKTSETALQTATATAAAGAQQAGAQVQALAPQVQAIGPRLDALKTQIEEAAATASRFNRAAAGLVVLASFRDAVVSGRPFAAELAAARVTLPAGAAQLDPFAATASEGFAPPAKLAARLAQEGGAAIGTPAPAPGDGAASLVDRLMASAESLVKVRPASGPGSVDAEGVLASAVAQVRAGQLDDALRTLKQLPESVQQRLSVLRDIEARATAVRVAGTLYQQQLVAISGKVP